MVDSKTVADGDSFTAQMLDATESLSPTGIRQVWDYWELLRDEQEPFASTDHVLLVVEPWLIAEELGIKRPLLLGTIEHDDESKGAILFDDLHTLDISIFENEVWGEDPVEMADVLEPVDISDSNEYIDDPGMMWLPRSQITAIELE